MVRKMATKSLRHLSPIQLAHAAVVHVLTEGAYRPGSCRKVRSESWGGHEALFVQTTNAQIQSCTASYEFQLDTRLCLWTPATAMHSLRLELYTRYAICMALMAVVSVQQQCRQSSHSIRPWGFKWRDSRTITRT